MLEEGIFSSTQAAGPESPVGVHWRTMLDLAASDKRDFPATLRRMLRAGAAMLGVARASFWTMHRDPQRILCELVYTGDESWISGTELRGPEHPAYFAALERSPLITAFDAANDPRTKELQNAYLHPTGIGAMLDVPVWVGGTLSGVLRHEHLGGVRMWSEEEQKIAMAIGNLVALAVAERDRFMVEAALKESEERFRATFEQSVVGLAHISLEHRFSWVNQGLCELLGTARSRLAGAKVLDFIHSEEGEGMEHLLWRLAVGESDAVTADRRFVRGNGEVVWVHITATLKRSSGGAAEYFVAIVQDITDRKRAEGRAQEQAELIDLTSDAVIVRSFDGRIIFWNRGAELIYGVPRLAAVGAREDEVLVCDPAATEAAARIVMQRGYWHGEMMQRTLDGREIVVDGRWTLMHGEDGKPRSILATNTDITERKALRAQFLEDHPPKAPAGMASGLAEAG
jgi:PAS domain S-box-containing protein